LIPPYPIALNDKSNTYNPLFFVNTYANYEPPLPSILFQCRNNTFILSFTVNKLLTCFNPTSVISFLLQFRYVNYVFFINDLHIIYKQLSPILFPSSINLFKEVV
jgi:hypothetical protein